ncbi:MAG: CAP domain-containing protein [Actinomycetota bacterium]|nr:CAP domain-containing protein [Actinomycetota bacterium]
MALLGLAGLFVTYGQGQPARAQGGEEQAFVQRINELRASKGLRTLTVDPYLTDLSRTWASAMRADGRISHAPDITAGVTVEWLKIGENVGVGGDVDALFDAFVASPTHYENLVDPLFTRIGVGVVWDGQVMYTTHRFMAMANGDPGAPATTAPPTTAPPTTPMRVNSGSTRFS